MNPRIAVSHALGLIGGAIGGVVGFFTFRWIVGQGFYALALPGAFLGIGAALLSRHDSIVRGVVCGVAALGLGLYCEWKLFPWIADPSFGYFLGHIPELRPITLLMIVVGGLVGFWAGKSVGITRLGGRGV